MEWLIVGDPHLKVQKLDDAKEFIAKLKVEAIKHRKVVLLGDLFDTFAVVRSEILSLWNDFFVWADDIDRPEIVALVGNHDYAGQSGGNHALEVFKTKVTVIQSLVELHGVYWMPFVRDKKQFEAQARSIPAGKILFCHQSVQGVEFEAGFSDPDGVDITCLEHLSGVISGHIHTTQYIKNVWYPGTPFQHSFGESGQVKYIHSIEIYNDRYSIRRQHDLDMPQFVTIEAPVNQMLELLPHPDPRHSYRFKGTGTPMEIAEFWKHPRTKGFRMQARRVVDALTPERGTVILAGSEGKNKKEKLDAFIKSRQWRTPHEQLIAAAGLYFRGQ